MRLKYAPEASESGKIHVWTVNEGDTDHLGAFDELCQDGDCFTADDLSGDREITVEDTQIEVDGDRTIRLHLEGIAVELSDQ